MRMRTALVTARSAPAHERAIRTLMSWKIEVDEAMFLGGLPKGEFLREFEPDFFFDDQTGHIESAARHVPAGHVASGRWLANHAFYRMELARFTQPEGATGKGTSPDNPDQRIQEDLNLFTSYSVSLSMGLLNALVTLASFVGILWGLSGAFDFKFNGASYEIPGFMVWMAVLYCVVGSVLTHYIGRPLIPLNFQQQRVEADFRHHMVRVREYSESIALDKGEAVERNQLDGRFGQVIGNYLRLLTAQKRLTWFTNGFGQAAVVFPFIVAAPRFFSGAIQLGELMQIASAFGRVQDSLSWFVDNYDRLASWRATTDRLTSFEQAISGQIAHDPSVEWSQDATESGAPSIADLTVRLPGGEVLLAGQTLAVAPGEQILLQGPSGSGKSTLFRSLAGIWPFAQGRVRLPASSMFIPQRPYFPNGPLRDALAYPEPASRYTDEALHQALTRPCCPTWSTAWTRPMPGARSSAAASSSAWPSRGCCSSSRNGCLRTRRRARWTHRPNKPCTSA
jgi:putative ATP-binding cassette transporter